MSWSYSNGSSIAANTTFLPAIAFTTTDNNNLIVASLINGTGEGTAPHGVTTISIIRIAIYAVSLFLGLTGNILVIITSIYHRKTISRSRFLIAHLALTDVFFTLRLPVQIVLELKGGRWEYGVFYCKIFHSFNSMSMLASIGTMTVIAIERYRGITKPFLAKIKRSTLIFGLAAVWTISILTYSPTIMFRQVRNDKCTEVHGDMTLLRVYSVFLFAMKYILPLVIIGWCYFKIVKTIKKRPKLNGQMTQRKRRKRNDNRIVTILIVMVIAFAILTLPASIWWLLFDFGGFQSTDASMQIIEVFAALVYFHSCTNPIVYFIMDKSFRLDVFLLFKCSHHRYRENYSMRSKSNNNRITAAQQNLNFDDVVVINGKSNSDEISDSHASRL